MTRQFVTLGDMGVRYRLNVDYNMFGDSYVITLTIPQIDFFKRPPLKTELKLELPFLYFDWANTHGESVYTAPKCTSDKYIISAELVEDDHLEALQTFREGVELATAKEYFKLHPFIVEGDYDYFIVTYPYMNLDWSIKK